MALRLSHVSYRQRKCVFDLGGAASIPPPACIPEISLSLASYHILIDTEGSGEGVCYSSNDLNESTGAEGRYCASEVDLMANKEMREAWTEAVKIKCNLQEQIVASLQMKYDYTLLTEMISD